MGSALDGIKVLDLTQGMAGAIATMFLCDNGARVIRIEPPNGDRGHGAPGYLVWDRGKESIFLDLTARAVQKRPDCDKDQINPLFERLLRKADVLIEGFSPSSPQQAVLNYTGLSAINPRLVHCSITPYGTEGPLKDAPADDDLVMARAGILASQPSFRPGPVHVVHPLPGVGAGLLAAQGIVASLYWREKTGLGRKVETSLMAGCLSTMPKVFGKNLSPWVFANRTAGGAPFYSLYECADGEWIQLACIHGGFVEKAVDVLGIREKLSAPKIGDWRGNPISGVSAEVFDIVTGAIKTRPYEEWALLLEEADVPYARSSTVEEAMVNPQALFNDMVIELDDPSVGRMSQMGLAVKLLKTPGLVKGPAPAPGQDTHEVLSELRTEPVPATESRTVDPDNCDPPLKGITVLEIGNVIAGPMSSRFLAEMGAEVIKLEPPGGDISRTGAPPFFYLNLNKRSISVNAKEPEGREVVQRLAASADVILENMRPGAAGRLGLGPEELEKLNPGLVYTHISAYGSAGPYSHRPGLDPLAQALTGLQRAQGGDENPPVFLGRLGPADYAAAMLGALGTVLALFARERSGVSQRVETNLLNAGILLGSEGFTGYEGRQPRRLADKGQYGLGALHRLYETAEGWLYLASETGKQWESLCAALGRADLAGDARFSSPERRADNDEALALELVQAFALHEREEWLRRLKAASVPYASVVEDYDNGFFSDPQAIANDMIVEHDHPTLGRLSYSKKPVVFPGSTEPPSRVTPLLGQHTAEILREVGYTEQEVADLEARGILKCWKPGDG